MATPRDVNSQWPPRLHNDVYPFIYPSKFRGQLKDKVTIITGSAGTIGQALAECFAVAGAKLVLTYNRTEPPANLKSRCTSLGAGAVSFVRCNVTDLKSCEKLIQQTLETMGSLDIVISNAGANSLIPLHLQDPEEFIQQLAVNLHGPYYLMRLAMPIFREQKAGCIINIASRAGTVDIPYSTSYCSSKAALINLTACTQKECDAEGYEDIHLYSLHPGGILSEMTAQKYSEESLKNLPAQAARGYSRHLDAYTDSPYLNGMASVALATGIAKNALRGKYFDVGQDLDEVIAQTSAVQQNPELYSLHTTFLGGLSNDGGPPDRQRDEEFKFPGFEVA